MRAKTSSMQETIGRVGQRRQVVIPQEIFKTLNMREGDFVAFSKQAKGVLMKPRRLVDLDDVLTPKEGALLKKAEREMKRGNYVTLAQLHHDLARKDSRRSRKTA